MSLGDVLVLEQTVHHLTRENSSGDAIAERRAKVMSRGWYQESE